MASRFGSPALTSADSGSLPLAQILTGVHCLRLAILCIDGPVGPTIQLLRGTRRGVWVCRGAVGSSACSCFTVVRAFPCPSFLFPQMIAPHAPLSPLQDHLHYDATPRVFRPMLSATPSNGASVIARSVNISDYYFSSSQKAPSSWNGFGYKYHILPHSTSTSVLVYHSL